MRRAASALLLGLLAAVTSSHAQADNVRWRLWRIEDGDQAETGTTGSRYADGTWRERHDLEVAHDGITEEVTWYAEAPGQPVTARRSLRFEVPPPPTELVYGQTYELRATGTAACTDWAERFGGAWTAGFHELRSDEAWLTFRSAERAGKAVAIKEAYVGGSLPRAQPALSMSRTYGLRPGFAGSTFRISAFAGDYALATYVYRRVEPGVTFGDVVVRRLPPRAQPAQPDPATPPAAGNADPLLPKPLAVSLSLRAFRQFTGAGFVAGQITVRAPDDVPAGTAVSVSVAVVPDRSEQESRALLLSLGQARPEQIVDLMQGTAIMARVQRRTLTLDANRQVTAPLDSTFATIVPSVAAGETVRRCRLLAVAWVGDTHRGEADAAFEAVKQRAGTRLAALTVAPNPAVAGQPVRITLTGEVQGLAPTATPPRISFTGRLLWHGAPAALWLDGRDSDQRAIKVPPALMLPDQREPARLVPDDATSARATVTWEVRLRGPGAYTVAVELSPEGYELLTYEQPFAAIEVRTGPPPPGPGEGTRREAVDATFGAVAFAVADGRARLTKATEVPGGEPLPAGAVLVSLNGDAVPELTVPSLSKLLAPFRDGSCTMGFRLPDGSQCLVAIVDEQP